MGKIPNPTFIRIKKTQLLKSFFSVFQTCHEEPDEAITLPRVSNGLEKDIGTMTEPESLGPCEPGTAVKLQGIVWQETDKGKDIIWVGLQYSKSFFW
jgi:hypothetical protein